MRWGVIKLRNKIKKAHRVEFFEKIIAQGLNTQCGSFLIVEQREKVNLGQN